MLNQKEENHQTGLSHMTQITTLCICGEQNLPELEENVLQQKKMKNNNNKNKNAALGTAYVLFIYLFIKYTKSYLFY